MTGRLLAGAALVLALSACAGDSASTKEPVNNDTPAIPDAPGDAGETAEKPAGQGQAGGAQPAGGTPAPAAAAGEAGEKTVKPYAVNVRSGPGMSNGVVKTLPKGAKVQAQSCEKGWCKVGEGEYVAAKLLE